MIDRSEALAVEIRIDEPQGIDVPPDSQPTEINAVNTPPANQLGILCHGPICGFGRATHGDNRLTDVVAQVSEGNAPQEPVPGTAVPGGYPGTVATLNDVRSNDLNFWFTGDRLIGNVAAGPDDQHPIVNWLIVWAKFTNDENWYPSSIRKFLAVAKSRTDCDGSIIGNR